MLKCNYFHLYGPFIALYLPTILHLCTLNIDVSIVLLTVHLFMCNVTLCSCFCHNALLYLGQVAVVNEKLFNWPTWLNKR
jgi:hypothetical protein